MRSMKKVLTVLTLMVLATAPLFAATNLTGTYSGALGEAPIKGTVKGNDVTIDFDASGAAVHYAGKISADGNKIEGTVDYGGQASGTFTATRSEAKDKK